MVCVAWLSKFIFIRTMRPVFQIAREDCNIPISISRLLAIWLAAQAFSQTVSTSAS